MSNFIDDPDRVNTELAAVNEVNEIADQMLPDAPLRYWHRSLAKSELNYLTPHHSKVPVSTDVLLSMRLTFAARLLKETVVIDPEIAGGSPVLAGTRFKIARVLAELADGMTVAKLAREFSLDKQKVSEFLRGLAIKLDRPFTS